MALAGKPHFLGNAGKWLRTAQHKFASLLQAGVEDVVIGRASEGVLEQAHKLRSAKSGGLRQFANRNIPSQPMMDKIFLDREK